MRKRVFFFFLFIIVLLYGLMVILPTKKSTPAVEKKTLNNGLKVLVKRNPSNEIVAIEFFFKGGSAVETRQDSGLTYLTASLLFKGTENKDFTRIAEGFDSIGGLWGLSVERDFSEVHLVIPKRNWEEGLKLLAEVLITPVFVEEEIDKEKELILQQIKSIEDNPFEFTYREFNEDIYGSHPYAKPTFGFADTVTRFSRSDIIRQYKRSFCARNAIVVVTGNVGPKEAIKSVEENFRRLPAGRRLNIDKQPVHSRGKKQVIKKPDLKQTMMFLGFKAPSVNDKDYPALKLLSALMGEGMSSRLFENIRDKKGIGYALGSFYPTRLDTSPFVFFLGVQPERLGEAEAAFWEEIGKVKFDDISEEEFKKAKNYLIGNFYLTQQRNKDQAYYLGWYETLGLGTDFDSVYLENIRNLGISRVKAAARKYLKEEKATLVILSPGKVTP